jgi:hypothetical protein
MRLYKIYLMNIYPQLGRGDFKFEKLTQLFFNCGEAALMKKQQNCVNWGRISINSVDMSQLYKLICQDCPTKKYLIFFNLQG